MAEITLTTANFEEEVLKSTTPVLVDFWASWCGPCMMMAPVVKELAEKYEGKLKVGKVDTDAEPALAAKYNINAIPTLIVFEGGKVADTMMGYRPLADLEAAIAKYIK